MKLFQASTTWLLRASFENCQNDPKYTIILTICIHVKIILEITLNCTKVFWLNIPCDCIWMLPLYQNPDAVWSSVELGAGFRYPEYAVVIPGALCSSYLIPLIFRGLVFIITFFFYWATSLSFRIKAILIILLKMSSKYKTDQSFYLT
jgi:hypothetical protein